MLASAFNGPSVHGPPTPSPSAKRKRSENGLHSEDLSNPRLSSLPSESIDYFELPSLSAPRGRSPLSSPRKRVRSRYQYSPSDGSLSTSPRRNLLPLSDGNECHNVPLASSIGDTRKLNSNSDQDDSQRLRTVVANKSLQRDFCSEKDMSAHPPQHRPTTISLVRSPSWIPPALANSAFRNLYLEMNSTLAQLVRSRREKMLMLSGDDAACPGTNAGPPKEEAAETNYAEINALLFQLALERGRVVDIDA
ncbi:hypothetical protein DFJ73DRAFT_819396 [Zopfochytrium polystomum]|nr:hypothetical protein DFJ73DRAFT_819396 [Zopfochytrium polystomum]